MRLLPYRFLISVLCAAALFGGTGCTSRFQDDPKEIFQRALTGLAGKEEMVFNGEGGIRTSDKGLFEHQFQYSGTLTNHNKLVIESRIVPGSKAAGLQIDTGKSDNRARSLTWVRKNKEWQIESIDGHKPATNRFNPLGQLEAIEQMKNNTFRLEQGTPMGKQMVRIELAGEEAIIHVRNQLKEEMKDLQNEVPTLASSVPEEKRKECLQELNTLYDKQNRLLDDKLNKAKATSVYHVLIDKKTSLPLRFSSESTINYKKEEGKVHKELLVTEVYFDGYK
ncbi:hypothetical protein [Paenibacillus sp. Marseille-Q4541]|uniref:hypothetical protein n=1 Tax=Paenibacillus sp. Marseille-Q4541 TaxID=2831522 RepID=UPI001BA4E800|nr:hypothetical protein [Paenibacillus sp. Marseille-Q4541]